MADLFGFEAPITWDDAGRVGQTRDGRRVSIDASVITGRWVALIPLHGKDVATRRACLTIDEARAAAERAVTESML